MPMLASLTAALVYQLADANTQMQARVCVYLYPMHSLNAN